MQTENHYTETDLGNVSPNPKGNYNNTVKYEYLDLVTMQGGSYLCVIPVGQTITGTAPEPGATTEYWQCLAMPGDRTPEYIEAHDKVVRLAKEVAQNTTKVAEDKQSVAQMETDVRQLKEQTAESARQAESSKDSAAGSARVAKTAEDNIRQVANNVNTLVNGFDTHVAEKTTEATQAVATAKDNAVQAVERQETASVQEVKDQTATYITEQKNLAKQELDDKVNQFGLDVNVIKAEVSKEGQKQITNVQEATTAELAKITEKGTEQAGIVTTEGEKQVQAVQTAAQEIIADREQIAKNKTDIADLRQNKADAIVESASGTLLNVKDSSDAYFENFSMAGKTTQDGTPTPDASVPIMHAGESGSIEIKVTGKNLINYKDAKIWGSPSQPSFIENGVIADTTKSFDNRIIYFNTVIPISKGEKYIFSLNEKKISGNSILQFYLPDISQYIDNNEEFTANETVTKIGFYLDGNNPSKFEVTDIMLRKIEASNCYEPYREPQTITLSLDRPLTKWDRLEKREGVWGIVRQSRIRELNGKEGINVYIPGNGNYEKGLHCYNIWLSDSALEYNTSYCTHFKNESHAFYPDKGKNGMYSGHANVAMKYFISDKPTIEDFKAWLVQQKEAGTPVELVYKTAEEIWEPLPEEMQSVLNALHTNYPTTIVTNSEETEMELSYVADTKNYTDRKIEEAVSAQTQNLANLLSLMPLSTQAAMIENDTNNILDMEVQK